MIRLPIPNVDYNLILDSCISSIQDPETKLLLEVYREIFLSSSKQYIYLGSQDQLSLFISRSNEITTNSNTLKKIINIYNRLRSNSGLRDFYDAIMIGSEFCAYCNMTIPESLDHYLQKNKFPLLSVTPSNLVPSCFSCNTKLNTYSSKGDALILHPYFPINDSIYDKQWVFARVPQKQKFFEDPQNPIISVIFYTDFSGLNIDKTTEKKLLFQFNALVLDKYISETARLLISEMNYLRRSRNRRIGFVDRNKLFFLQRASSFPINSYQSAVYNALANSDLFLQTSKNKFGQ